MYILFSTKVQKYDFFFLIQLLLFPTTKEPWLIFPSLNMENVRALGIALWPHFNLISDKNKIEFNMRNLIESNGNNLLTNNIYILKSIYNIFYTMNDNNKAFIFSHFYLKINK